VPVAEVLRCGFGATSIAAFAVALSDAGVVAIAIRETPDDTALHGTQVATYCISLEKFGGRSRASWITSATRA